MVVAGLRPHCMTPTNHRRWKGVGIAGCIPSPYSEPNMLLPDQEAYRE